MQRKFISRRSFLKCSGMGAVTAAAAGLLAGCGGSDSSSSSTASSAAAAEPADPNKPYAGVTLYYAATDTEATGPEMQDIVAMVKEKTGINIEFNIIPKADTGEVDKRLVSLQAGDALDIVYGTVAQLKVFYDAGVLEPLDELASAASYDIKSVFGDSAPVYDDGQTYGLPAFTDVWCTFINTKVFQTVEKVPSSRHVRMDGTHTGKFGAESVRAALRRVRGSAPNFVPRGILGGRNFCRAYARRNGFPLKRVVFRHAATPRCLRTPAWRSPPPRAGPGRSTSRPPRS